jgi:hypothetical protein
MEPKPIHRKSWFKPACVYAAYVGFLLLYWAVYAVAPDFHGYYLRGEDRFAEWLTFMGFFVAFVVMARTLRFRAKMSRFAFLYISGLTFFFFVCAGEEISWAQRIIGFDTPPTLGEINEQNEFNIHNLNFEHIHPVQIVALFMELFGIILPILFFRNLRRPDGYMHRYIGPLWLVPCFLMAESLNKLARLLKPWVAERFGHELTVIMRSDHRELNEMYWGWSVMLASFALHAAWKRYRPSDAETAAR